MTVTKTVETMQGKKKFGTERFYLEATKVGLLGLLLDSPRKIWTAESYDLLKTKEDLSGKSLTVKLTGLMAEEGGGRCWLVSGYAPETDEVFSGVLHTEKDGGFIEFGTKRHFPPYTDNGFPVEQPKLTVVEDDLPGAQEKVPVKWLEKIGQAFSVTAEELPNEAGPLVDWCLFKLDQERKGFRHVEPEEGSLVQMFSQVEHLLEGVNRFDSTGEQLLTAILHFGKAVGMLEQIERAQVPRMIWEEIESIRLYLANLDEVMGGLDERSKRHRVSVLFGRIMALERMVSCRKWEIAGGRNR